jgi:hypothetical protein
MRYELPSQFLARVYLDAASATNAVDALQRLPQILGDNTLQGIAVDPTVAPGFAHRPAFVRPQEGLQLVLLAGSFDVMTQPTDALGTNMTSFEAFAARASEILAQTLEVFGRRGHRVAIVQEGFLREMAPETLDGVRDRLLMLPQSLRDPFEWDWRAVARADRTFGRNVEACNILASVKRLTAQIGDPARPFLPRTIDRLHVVLDVNTSPANLTERFGPDDVRAFGAGTPGWHEALSAEVSVLTGLADAN